MLLEFSKPLLIKSLLVCLVTVSAITFLANFLGEGYAVIIGNYIYIPIQITLLAVTIWAVRYFGVNSIQGIGWMSFLGFVVCWFAGDVTWIIQEIILHVEPYPSVSDIFYLSGYPFLLIFVISYIIPFRDAISKNTVVISVCAVVTLVVLSIYTIDMQDTSSFDTSLLLAYPIFDSIILIPVMLGLILFFKSTTDVMWSLILFGILATFVGDISFAYMEYFGIYHTGNMMELAFYFSYILLIFGLIYHKKMVNSLGKHST